MGLLICLVKLSFGFEIEIIYCGHLGFILFSVITKVLKEN